MAIPTTPEPAELLLAGTGPDSATELLREAGYPVRHASSGAALLRLARSAPLPDLILLGDAVGEQPGHMLLAQLQSEKATRDIPVLFVSDGGDEELALALGARDCLSLPLRPLLWLARIQAQLRLRQLDYQVAA